MRNATFAFACPYSPNRGGHVDFWRRLCALRRIGGHLVFMGNLATSNAVRGVEWLLQEICPPVLAQRPGIRFVVAGPLPGVHVEALCQAETATGVRRAQCGGALPQRHGVGQSRTNGQWYPYQGDHMLKIALLVVPATQEAMGLPSVVKRLPRVADTAEPLADQLAAARGFSAYERDVSGAARRLLATQGLADRLPAWQRSRQVAVVAAASA